MHCIWPAKKLVAVPYGCSVARATMLPETTRVAPGYGQDSQDTNTELELPYFLPVLSVENLGKRYASKWIFRGISFTLEQGQSLVVLGHNGCGKSTLLKTIAGLIDPTEGKRTLPEGDPRQTVTLTNLDIHLYAQLTPAEHLELAGKLRGCPPKTDELLERVGLNHARRLYTSQMSTGMRARLKIALAIQTEPKLLLFDEPGAGLDQSGRDLLDEISKEQIQRGALIVATNDPLERRFASLELDLAG